MSMAWNEYDLEGTKRLLLAAYVELHEERKSAKLFYDQNKRLCEKVATLEKAVGVATEEAAKLKEYARKLDAALADMHNGGPHHDRTGHEPVPL